jgi:hypothetical protein
MALTCNSFTENTLLVTQQEADCKQQTYGLTDTGLGTIQTQLLILDFLERLGIGPDIADVPMCDAEQALRAATCAVLPLTTPGDEDLSKINALILYKLNEEVCSA